MKIFYDVDTQNDFMNPDGALYVPDAEKIKPNLKKLTDYALQNDIPIFGSVDIHYGTEPYKEIETELQRFGGPFPDHCITGTSGADKIKETSIDAYVILPSNPKRINVTEKIDNDEIVDSVEQTASGLFFEKQSYDVFRSENNPGGNKLANEMLKDLEVTEAIVYGVVLEICVYAAIKGFLERGIKTTLVMDATMHLDKLKRDASLIKMIDKGLLITDTETVLNAPKACSCPGR